MNKSRALSTLLAVVIFLIGVICGTILDKILVSKWRGHRPFDARFIEKRDVSGNMLHRFEKDLDLTAEQKVKISAILEEQKKEMEKLMKDVHPRIEARMNAFREKIRNVLDDKQKEKFDKMVEKHKGREKGEKMGGKDFNPPK